MDDLTGNTLGSATEPLLSVDLPATNVLASTQVTKADLTEAVRSTALLADLTVSIWSGETIDRQLSDKIKADAGAVGNTGKYVKNLMAGCDNALRDVRSAYQGARSLHYKLTLPWASASASASEKNIGPRLLPNLLFDDYLTRMSKMRTEAIKALDGFLRQYPDLIVQAQANLAGMAKPEDYPAPEEIRKRFKLTFDFSPIPAFGSFVGMSDIVLDKLSSQLRKRQEAYVATAQGEMWDRAKKVIDHMIGRLSDPETEFKVNTLNAVRDLVRVLPRYNCAGDQRVATVVNDIATMLDGVEPDMLRKNLDVRSDVVRQAQALNDKMARWGL